MRASPRLIVSQGSTANSAEVPGGGRTPFRRNPLHCETGLRSPQPAMHQQLGDADGLTSAPPRCIRARRLDRPLPDQAPCSVCQLWCPVTSVIAGRAAQPTRACAQNSPNSWFSHRRVGSVVTPGRAAAVQLLAQGIVLDGKHVHGTCERLGRHAVVVTFLPQALDPGSQGSDLLAELVSSAGMPLRAFTSAWKRSLRSVLWVPKTCPTWADALGIALDSVKRLGVGRPVLARPEVG